MRVKSREPKVKVVSKAAEYPRPGTHAKQPLLPRGVLTEALWSEDGVVRVPKPRVQTLLEPEGDPEIKSEAISFLRKGSVGRPLVRAVKREAAGQQPPPQRQMLLKLPRRLSPPQRKPQEHGPKALLKTLSPSPVSSPPVSNADYQVLSSNMSDIDITPMESVRDPWDM